jgi:hypothetical protein
MAVPDLFKIVARGLQDERLQPGVQGVPSIDRYVSVYKATTRWAAQFVRVDFDNLYLSHSAQVCTTSKGREGGRLNLFVLHVTLDFVTSGGVI